MPNSITDYTASLAYTYNFDDPPPPDPQPAPATKQFKPLDQQIIELMRSLPPQLRDRPWSMAELVQRLHGKFRDRPHGQQVGQALLKLGWRKERRWERGWDGARVWVQG